MKDSLIFSRELQREEFAQLYAASGLELGENWAETALFSFSCRETGQLIGAATVAFRFGRFILDFVAIRGEQRKSGIGRELVLRCMQQCRELGSRELWLQARTPAFFKRLGAEETGGTTLLCECLNCPDYGKDCSPVEMKLRL